MSSVIGQFAEDVADDMAVPQPERMDWLQLILDVLVPLIQDCFGNGASLERFARSGPNRIQNAQLLGVCRREIQQSRNIGPFAAGPPARRMRASIVKTLGQRANAVSPGDSIWNEAVAEAQPVG